MPKARVNGVELYYERHGGDDPLLWIGGLGANLLEIPYLVQSYSRHVEMVVYDQRGCGRSDIPEGEFSIAGWADDAAALIETLGLGAPVVYGSSMGGMVAQELALRHPERVGALILGCTSPSSARGSHPSPETIQTIVRNTTLEGDAALEAGWQLGYSAEYIETNRDAMFERCRVAATCATPRESYVRQVLAAARHDALDHLSDITCPVMILHGSEDLMLPVGNAYLLKESIPHAELHVLDGLGHGYNLEGQERVDPLVIDFVRRHCAAQRERARAVR
jgi:3-oxoadipate enol-lactonase